MCNPTAGIVRVTGAAIPRHATGPEEAELTVEQYPGNARDAAIQEHPAGPLRGNVEGTGYRCAGAGRSFNLVGKLRCPTVRTPDVRLCCSPGSF